MKVPCGRCHNCRKAKSREWALRLLHESTLWDHSIFLTLTYNDDHLPYDMSLRKTTLQKYLKRLRKRIGDRKIKYYACGEYGPDGGRPHYHMVIFGLALWEHQLGSPRGKGYEILGGPGFTAWHPRGFVAGGSINYGSLRYITDYVSKKSDIPTRLRQQRLDDLQINIRSTYLEPVADVVHLKQGYQVQRPFQLCSQGIGKEYLHKHKERLLRDMGCAVTTGKIAPLPRYYVKKLLEQHPELSTSQEWAKWFTDQDTVTRIREKHPLGSVNAWLSQENRQKERNSKAKERLTQ